MKYDVCIIGAGIIGTTLAYELSHKKLKICVVEKNEEPGLAQTLINSKVIHTGVYYKDNQNILNFCLEGKNYLKDYCKLNKIFFQQRGKLIHCNSINLEMLIERCKNYKIEYRVENDKLFLPEASLMSYKEFTDCLYYKTADYIDYYFGETDYKITEKEIFFKNFKSIEFDKLINVAGTSSIDIYRKLSKDYSYVLCEIAGHIHNFSTDEDNWRKMPLIYKFPDKTLPFLGPHITPNITCGIKLGPSACPKLFSVTHKNKQNDVLVRKKFIHNNNIFFKWNEQFECPKKTIEECYKLYNIKINFNCYKNTDIGIRSILLNQNGEPFKDFIFKETKNAIHFLNSHSPAATSTFAIAKHISNML